jgi:SAM-dependent methyltransferase
VLDLGCGIGRVLTPLVKAGYEVVGVDCSVDALEQCARTLAKSGLDARLVAADFLALRELKRCLPARSFDAIVCLGNTFMTVVDVEQAAQLLRFVHQRLKRGGAFIIDDFPHELWPELTEGNWQTGVSEDGVMQMVWRPGDAVFAIRRGRAINHRSWVPKEGDELRRLWCEGSLRLLAGAARLSGPRRETRAGLLVMTHSAR